MNVAARHICVQFIATYNNLCARCICYIITWFAITTCQHDERTKGISFYSSFIKSIAKWYERVFLLAFVLFAGHSRLFLLHIPLLFVFSSHLYLLGLIACSYACISVRQHTHGIIHAYLKTKKSRTLFRRKNKEKYKILCLKHFVTKCVRISSRRRLHATIDVYTRNVEQKKKQSNCMHAFDSKLFAHSHCE